MVTEREIERSLDASVRDVAGYGVMLGLGEMYLGAYAVHLGASSLMLGLLASAPPFLGSLVQIWNANLLERIPRRRTLFLAGATVQMIMWPVIVLTIWFPRDVALSFLLPAVILYFSGNHFASPAWFSTMGDLVPPESRGRFFAWRGRTCILCQLLGAILAGTGLHVFEGGSGVEIGYSLIFGGACLARLSSIFFAAKMVAPSYTPSTGDRFSIVDFVRAMPRSNFAHFVLYTAAVSFSVNLAGPFFAPYMLKGLGFSYTEFMVAQAAMVAGQIVQLYTWGPLIDRFGNKRIVALCGAGITIGPLLWVLCRHPAYIYLLQFFAGISWSGFNLGASNFILDAVTPGKRARCTAYFSLFQGAGLLLGGLTGAWILDRVPATLFGFALFSPVYGVMLASFLARLLTQILLLRSFREVRVVTPIETMDLLLRATHLKPTETEDPRSPRTEDRK